MILKNRTCYYFDYIIRFKDKGIDFSDVLLNEKLYIKKTENILIYDISYKVLTNAKPLRIRFDEIDGFIEINERIRYLVLFDYGWFL